MHSHPSNFRRVLHPIVVSGSGTAFREFGAVRSSICLCASFAVQLVRCHSTWQTRVCTAPLVYVFSGNEEKTNVEMKLEVNGLKCITSYDMTVRASVTGLCACAC